MSNQAEGYIKFLEMIPHPEGGYFKENYRSEMRIQPHGFDGIRNIATSIFFLLEAGNFSALHRIKSDEIWHFYDGDPLEIIEITESGEFTTTILGKNLLVGEKLVHVVKSGNWFGSRPKDGSRFCLVGCSVSPGFDFADFEMPKRDFFLSKFPQHEGIISQMTRL